MKTRNRMMFSFQIIEVEMPFDKTKNQRKGFCFITFESEQVVNELLKTPKQTIGGKEVRPVRLSSQRTNAGEEKGRLTIAFVFAGGRQAGDTEARRPRRHGRSRGPWWSRHARWSWWTRRLRRTALEQPGIWRLWLRPGRLRQRVRRLRLRRLRLRWIRRLRRIRLLWIPQLR